QGRGILPGLSAVENLRLAWTGDSDEAEQEAVDRVVGLFPRLERLLDRRGGALSGGEQQLLALARAPVPNPWVVLLDEPSEGAQPSIVHEIGQILSRLRGKAGLAVVIVEQNLDLVLDVASRIAVMEKGRIEREFEADQVGATSALVAALGMGTVRTARGGDRSARAAAAPGRAPAGGAPAARPVVAARPPGASAAQPPAAASRRPAAIELPRAAASPASAPAAPAPRAGAPAPSTRSTTI